jgi:citronellol/citronellal dehydrogenase
MSLAGKTLFITGASRGIGKAIALRAARDGAQVAILGKTAEPHPRLPGTIHSAASEVEAAGGRALALATDVRDEVAVRDAVARAAAHFGGIDILVNNASAIQLTSTPDTPMKRFDLMMAVNVRASFLCAQACHPWLAKSTNAHILNLAPPIDLRPAWFQNHVAYTISKVGMSLCVLGMAEEFRSAGIAVNALWPRTIIATAALSQVGDAKLAAAARKPEIVADAAHAILCRASRACTGNFFLDEDVLRAEGVSDFSRYAAVPGTTSFIPDLFVDG